MAPNCGRGTRNLYCSGRSFGSRGSKSSTLASTPPASVAPILCAKTPSRASNESASRVGVGNGKKAEGCPSGERAEKSTACPGPNPNTRPPPTHTTSVHANLYAMRLRPIPMPQMIPWPGASQYQLRYLRGTNCERRPCTAVGPELVEEPYGAVEQPKPNCSGGPSPHETR